MVQKQFPEVKTISNDMNIGFAGANNQGLKLAKGRYYLLLNSDTVLKRPIEELVELMDRMHQVGVLGCRVVFGNGQTQKTCWRFPSLFREWYYFSFDIIRRIIPKISELRYQGIDFNNLSKPDCVSGCFFLLRREVVEQIGGFDERFFMYYEDSEYCYRVKKLTEYEIIYYPNYEIIHYHGKSRDTATAIHLSFQSAKYYFNKIYGKRYSKVFAGFCALSWSIDLLVLVITVVIWRSPRVQRKIDLLKRLLLYEIGDKK